jgi:hypothetical protein
MKVQVIRNFHDSINGINRFVGDVFECDADRVELLIDIWLVEEFEPQIKTPIIPEDDATERTG